MKTGLENVSFLIFDIYYVALKIVTYVISCTGYASMVKILVRFDLIKAPLSSFRLSHLISFRPILGSHRIILDIFRVF